MTTVSRRVEGGAMEPKFIGWVLCKMNHRLACLMAAAATCFALSASTVANDQAASQPGYVHPVLRPDSRKFDPRDLNGIWTRGNPGGGFSGAESCVRPRTQDGPCGDRGFSLDWPSFTPEGQAAFENNRPSYGRRLGSQGAAAHPEEHIGRRRAVEGALGNDPIGTCNPMGVTRAVLFPQEWQFVFLKDRILQHFSQTNAWRIIWMDGRSLPKHDEIPWPLWYGYSIGRWQGDTLVVETVGQDDRVWVDQFGYPLSDQAHIEERYRRVNFSVLQLDMTLTDPKYYTKPWKSETKKFLWRPKDYFKNSTWPGMYYDDCAPIDEVDNFKALIVDPAAAASGAEAPPAAAASIKEVMTAVIAPATDTLWQAENPQTDAEWRQLENAALAVIAAGAAINLGGSGPRDGEWARDPSWRTTSAAMSKAAADSLAAVRKRDIDALLEAGSALYTPCSDCHQKFSPAITSK